ncbi:MAG: gamma-glutamylcyclotransferase [Rhodobacteraceae bacterium]|nr:gamma-glutamylcyclotransferase [Paracoccaceae bacterium]
MNTDELWVFGYGSLLWAPGFDWCEKVLATLNDHSRLFCMRSIHYRGTKDNPGLVLALVAQSGGRCQGLAYRVEPIKRKEALSYLRKRELISSAYLERQVSIKLVDGRRRMATTFVMDRSHDQYCGNLPMATQAQIISTAVGEKGPNAEYLQRTVERLATLGIEDGRLERLNRLVADRCKR